MAEKPKDKPTYRSTLNLPKTSFSMKAGLVEKEPAAIKKWQQQKLYDQIRQVRAGSPTFSFHDGPPYANGSIHLGHLLNKVLKDIVVRSKTMAGFDVPYVPGWDCHGLPIEHKVMEQLGDKAREMVAPQIRKRCRDYAEKFVKLQSQQMQRLLTLADYDNPYLTMAPEYEAAVLEVFSDLVGKGLVYRDLKPVHWSVANRTALAEAELEYYEREDTSVYVMFDVSNAGELPESLSAPEGENISLMIWTTTPWTLPANLAVAVGAGYSYGLYRFSAGGNVRHTIVATDLADKIFKAAGVEDASLLGECTGQQLQDSGITYQHPFRDMTGIVVTAMYVTLEDGTGMVHTAPGHGKEDYDTGKRYGLDIYCPVKADGTFDETAPDWLQNGVTIWQANDLVVEHLRSSGHLLHDHKFRHEYPHDWRGKTPVIFRATEQWFVGVDKPYSLGDDAGKESLRHMAKQATENDIRFLPEWGRNRMRGMIESRPDWCLSRQRAWGLPIPAFFDDEGRFLLTAASVKAVADQVRLHGSDYWFHANAAELLVKYIPAEDPDAPDWLKHDGHNLAKLTKSRDIFDVWFESGSSWNAVLRQRFGAAWYPADLYLEGSDQHRGWFQLSMLPALGTTNHAPFETVLTHGFIVDKNGHKMSKSEGNTIEVEALMKEFGADVCRWWVATLNTENDIKADMEYFRLAGEEYRKVRNTIRYMLGNLGDFDPNSHGHNFSSDDANSIDAWALNQLMELVDEVRQAYEHYQLRRAREAIYNFCNDTLSAVYLTAIKDRLYCDAPDARRRRRTQTALYKIADALVRLLAPLLPYTSDEAWQSLRNDPTAPSVHLQLLPEPQEVVVDENFPRLMALRDAALKKIEQSRASSDLDNPIDLGLRIAASDELAQIIRKFDAVDLADLCGVSRVELAPADGESESGDKHLEKMVHVIDLRDQPRCERSWKRDGTVKERSDGGMLSDRDATALGV